MKMRAIRVALAVFCWPAMLIGLRAQPSVPAGGILNAGSYALSGLPNGGIAQGSIFVVFGAGMGPAALVSANAFPLPIELSGTSVQIKSGSITVAAVMLYASATQVSAILPSNTPVGDGTLTVTYNGQTSAPTQLHVVASSFGIFARSQRGGGPAWVQHAGATGADIFNSLVNSGKPGGVFIIYGTGLGPVADDRNPSPVQDLPVDVRILAGGKDAAVLYKGRSPQFPGMDQINFQLPNDVPEGCYVPLAVKAGGVVSNYTSLSISSSSRVCSVTGGISATDLTKAASGQSLSLGIAALTRTRLILAAGPFGNLQGKDDTFTGSFLNLTPDTLFAARGLAAGFGLPPLGTCTAFPFKTLGTIDEVVSPPGLDAGSALTVKGPVGTKQVTGSSGVYTGVLGGTVPNLPGIPGAGQMLPDFLEPGSYSITGSGGAAVGAISANLDIAAPLNWTNREAIPGAPRNQPLTIAWDGGGANQFAIITGLSSSDPAGQGGAGFVCVEQAGKGTFTIPTDVLSSLPVSASLFGVATGTLSLGTSILVTDKPKVQGLDVFYASYTDSTTRNIAFQ